MENKKIQLNLYIREHYRDLLQRMAAERMLKNPKRAVSASKIGAEIVGEYLEKFESNKERRLEDVQI